MAFCRQSGRGVQEILNSHGPSHGAGRKEQTLTDLHETDDRRQTMVDGHLLRVAVSVGLSLLGENTVWMPSSTGPRPGQTSVCQVSVERGSTRSIRLVLLIASIEY